MPRFYRWVPREFADAAIAAGLVSHNGAATWIFRMDDKNGYRPNKRISDGALLIAYDLDDIATTNVTTIQTIDFEDDSFAGEAAHPGQIITKNNEPGAYGIGRHRQMRTNYHATASYATKAEVARALAIDERSVDDRKFRPGRTWPT